MSEASHTGFLGSNRSRLIAALALVTGLLIAAVIILIVSRTTFTAQTTTGTNTWSTGTVVLTNDHVGTAVFEAQNLKPGDSDTQVVRVDYTGSIVANVNMYATTATPTQTLDQHIDLVISTNATGVAPWTSAWTGTLAQLEAADFTTALAPWTNAGPSDNFRYYQIQFTLNAATPNDQQGESATAVFAWEARAA